MKAFRFSSPETRGGGEMGRVREGYDMKGDKAPLQAE